MADDIQFSRGPARRPAPIVADPLLQWSTGLPTHDRRIYAGWLCPVGQSETLDEAMDRAGYNQITIKHGGGNVVDHWQIETASLFILAEGIQSQAEMKHSPQRYGVAFGWRKLPNDNGTDRWQSQLRFRALLRDLLEEGYHEPLLITAKSTLTSDLLKALAAQYDVLDAIDAFRREAGKPLLHAPFYACSLLLGPGAEVSRGSTQTKAIVPITAHIPNPITKEYILANWPQCEWVALIESHLDHTIAWSVTESAAIAATTDLIEYSE